ncbi:hypothetical protein RRG08_039494 [Elysia crispata]|uniref:Uncharacterized protein n=1 Tax=Elysia crispata TaxID=231223 RepID=A0AAE0YK84_9GAST|nr:hypothetical protein RRG08_039494 [Elysia crispata]
MCRSHLNYHHHQHILPYSELQGVTSLMFEQPKPLNSTRSSCTSPPLPTLILHISMILINEPNLGPWRGAAVA